MTRAVLKEKKIALKSPARALSNGAVYLFRQELLQGAIIESNLLSLHGHCVAIGMTMTLSFKIDTINRPTTHPKKSRSCLATYRNMLNKLSQIFACSCLGKLYFNDVFFLTYSDSKRGEKSIFRKWYEKFCGQLFFRPTKFSRRPHPEKKVGHRRSKSIFFAFLEFPRDFIFRTPKISGRFWSFSLR